MPVILARRGASLYLHNVHAVGVDMPAVAGVRVEPQADRLHNAAAPKASIQTRKCGIRQGARPVMRGVRCEDTSLILAAQMRLQVLPGQTAEWPDGLLSQSAQSLHNDETQNKQLCAAPVYRHG